MQEEVNEKIVSLSIRGATITADILKAAIRKYLNSMDRSKNQKEQVKIARKTEYAREKVRQKEEKRNTPQQGKQTLKKLAQQGAELKNIEITENNVKSFDKVARKYGIDYSLKKDFNKKNPRYLVFFKARDVDVMTAAFQEYAGVTTLNKEKKKSLVKKLAQAKKQVEKQKQRVRVKVKQKNRSQSL